MLKIAEYRKVLGEDGKSIRREKIDLKELEKFGFEPMQENYRGDKYIWKRESNYQFEEEYYYIYINKNNYIRIVVNGNCVIAGKLQDKLYDLFQAGLVEKVSDS